MSHAESGLQSLEKAEVEKPQRATRTTRLGFTPSWTVGKHPQDRKDRLKGLKKETAQGIVDNVVSAALAAKTCKA